MRYSEINAKAEETAYSIYRNIGSEMPSIFELLRWLEETFGKKIRITMGGEKHFSRFLGLEYFDPEVDAYRVWIKADDYALRQNFTLAHELAHIVRNSQIAFGFSDGDIDSLDGEERYCNRFAAAFLMPRDLFIKKWKAISDDITFKKLRMVSFFKVSGEAVYHRANELGLI